VGVNGKVGLSTMGHLSNAWPLSSVDMGLIPIPRVYEGMSSLYNLV
jgi:hypothetical protein